jgi:hypothetical protein
VTQPTWYRAFLSYSHSDTPWAKRLHGRLESFKLDTDLVGRETPMGKVPDSLRPIFRDRHDFDAGGSLSDQTATAIECSAALIVLASPRAAQSKFVNEELLRFKSHHPERPVIPVIVDGEPGHPENECFPAALRFAVTPDGVISDTPIDVLAADLRDEGDGFDLAVAKVVARLIGLAPDEVYRRAERERRKQAKRSRRIQAVIYTLLTAVIFGLIGWINQDYIKERFNWFFIMRPYTCWRTYVRMCLRRLPRAS